MADEEKFLINVRENVKNYILDKVIASCYKTKFENCETNIFMLIVDSKTSKLLNYYVQYPDLIDKGIIGVEKLELARKPFPNMHAQYFITPEEEAIEKVEKDFADPKNPTYGYAHIVFNNHVTDDLIKFISEQRSLLPYLVNQKHIYLDFSVEDNALLTLRKPRLLKDLYSKDGSQQIKSRLCDELGDQICTLVSALKAWKNVQVVYNTNHAGQEGPAKKIGKRVVRAQERMKGETKTYKALPPNPLVLVIMDRTMDPVTPLLHDLIYHPLVFDLQSPIPVTSKPELMQIKNNRTEFETVNEKNEKQYKIVVFNEKNSLWVKYRNWPFINARQSLFKEFNHFIANNSAAKVQQGQLDNQDTGKMAQIVREMPHYQEMMNEYSFHINLLNKAASFFTQRNLVACCELEQSVVTGVDKNNKIYKFANPENELKKFKVQSDKTRFILSLRLAHKLDPALWTKQSNGLNKDEQNYHNKQWEACESMGLKAGTHSLAVQDVEKIDDNPHAYQDRTTPKIREVIEGLRSEHGKLPEGFEEEFVIQDSQFPAVRVKKGENLKRGLKGVDDAPKPVFCVFVIGGIGTNEVREIRDIENDKELGGIITICGGTSYMTPLDYLHELEIINQPELDVTHEDDEENCDGQHTNINVGEDKGRKEVDEEARPLKR